MVNHFVKTMTSARLEPILNQQLNLMYGKIFTDTASNVIFDCLDKELSWQSNCCVRIFGKDTKIPRQQCCYGEQGVSYAFSGTKVEALPWPPIILELKTVAEKFSKCTFNLMLANRYKNGLDYVGEHRDNEKDLDASAPIASFSFGQERDFYFKHQSIKGVKCEKNDDVIPKVNIKLENGSLLIMLCPTNQYWYHSLPKRAVSRCPLPRINLTFRKIITK